VSVNARGVWIRGSVVSLLVAAAPLLSPAAAQQGQAAEPTDSVLYAKLAPLVESFHGRVGIYVRHLPSGRGVSINADELFPTASMIKLPILIAAFDAMERGELAFDQQLVYTDSLLYEGEDILGSFADSATIPFNQVLLLMITTSDNTAALWTQHLVGMGTRVNEWLSAHGFESTRVNSRTPGRRENQRQYGWGQTTPREMAELLVTIREGRVVNRAASEAMYRFLTRIYWNGEALSQIGRIAASVLAGAAVESFNPEVFETDRVTVGFDVKTEASEPDAHGRTSITVGDPAGGLVAQLPSDVHLYHETRTSPVLLPGEMAQRIRIRLKTADRKIVHLPESHVLENAVGRYTLSAEEKDGWVMIDREITLDLTTIPPQAWPDLRALLLEEMDAAGRTILIGKAKDGPDASSSGGSK